MPTNPKRHTGSKPVRRRTAPTKAASSAPTNLNEEQEWHEGHASDLDALRSYDPLFIRCRQYPEVHEWCVALHHLLLQAQHAGRWAERTSSQRDSGIEATDSSTKLVSVCRVIQQAVRDMIDLDPEPLLLVQARRFRSKHLGGLSGMDAALSLGRWLNSGFACIGIDAKPKPISWTTANDATRVNWNGVKQNTQTLARWLSTNLKRTSLDEARGAARSDLAWLCRRHARDAARKTDDRALNPKARRRRPSSYAEACEQLLQAGNPEDRRTVLDKNGEVKRRCCEILYVLDEGCEVNQKVIGDRLTKRLRTSLTRSQIGYAVRAMHRLGLLTSDPKCRRTPLGTLMMTESVHSVDAPAP